MAPRACRQLTAELTSTLPSKRGDEKTARIGRSKGGLTTKIHASCDALGNPTGFHLTPGQVSNLEGADAFLPDLLESIQAFLADKAYEAQERVLDLLKKKPACNPSYRQGKPKGTAGI